MSAMHVGHSKCAHNRCVLPVLWCVQTNNPRKIDVLSQLGVKINGRIPCQVQAGKYNEVR
jgi:hypothetical protein